MIKNQHPSLDCPNCDKRFTPTRRNQTCCSADCRRQHETRKRQIRRQKPPAKATCDWCETVFTPKPGQKYCSPDCRRAEDDFCKAWGRRLYDIVIKWRYRGRKSSLSAACQIFARMWQARKQQIKGKSDA